MARRPSSGPKLDPNAPTQDAEAAAPNETKSAEKAADPRETVVNALFALLTEKPWGEIGLYDIAERAGISLGELRALFPSKGAVLAGFVRQIDLDVLAHDAKDMSGEPVREKLFDVLMRRFEAMAPHREALRAVRKGIALDPLGASALNQLAVSSMQWMLAAAGIQESGPLGAARAQALVLVNARVFNTFLDDDDEGLARTMKALDEELRKAERWAQRADEVGRMTAPFRSALDRIFGRATTRRSKDPDIDDMASAA